MSAPAPGSSGGSGKQLEPVGELRFKVEIPGVEIGYFAECSGLQAEYEVIEQEVGGYPYKMKFRGAMKVSNLVLKRGVTTENALAKWFFATRAPAEYPTLTVTLLDPHGRPVQTWVCVRAFPVKWQGPSLNAGSNKVATETLEVAYVGIDQSPAGSSHA